MDTTPTSDNSSASVTLRALMLFLALAATQSHGADLIKADNATDLGTAGSYTSVSAVPTASDMVGFDNTLVTNSVFSWTSNRTVQGIRVAGPASDLTINLAGATFDFNNSGGTVIDMSAATRSLTLATTSSSAAVRVRGTTVGGAVINVATGQTLGIQTNLFYNNSLNGTISTVHFTGAGNVTVDGNNGRISDKATGTGTLTAIEYAGTGALTLSTASSYSGGTTLTSGTLVAGASKALGDGAVSVSGGVLDLKGTGIVNLTLAANKDFSFAGGSLKLDLGTSSDQISGSGTGKFNLSGGTLSLSLGTGFDYGVVYQIFNGFDAGLSSVSAITITGFDTGTYQATLNQSGQLSFALSMVPEPSTYAVLCGGLVFACAVVRRRRLKHRAIL
jgi:autotransporter-associated beta strand protein